MLTAMRRCIFVQKRTALLQASGELTVDGDAAQRRLPSTLTHDRQSAAHAGVIWAHHKTTFGDFQPGEDGARDVAGIHVACVRNDASESGQRFLPRNLGRDRCELHRAEIFHRGDKSVPRPRDDEQR